MYDTTRDTEIIIHDHMNRDNKCINQIIKPEFSVRLRAGLLITTNKVEEDVYFL